VQRRQQATMPHLRKLCSRACSTALVTAAVASAVLQLRTAKVSQLLLTAPTDDGRCLFLILLHIAYETLLHSPKAPGADSWEATGQGIQFVLQKEPVKLPNKQAGTITATATTAKTTEQATDKATDKTTEQATATAPPIS
jgi:hypothetical protein